jgi:hypothetical protein
MKKNKQAIKRVKKVHSSMFWFTHSTDEVCKECKVPYPCRTILAIEGS